MIDNPNLKGCSGRRRNRVACCHGTGVQHNYKGRGWHPVENFKRVSQLYHQRALITPPSREELLQQQADLEEIRRRKRETFQQSNTKVSNAQLAPSPKVAVEAGDGTTSDQLECPPIGWTAAMKRQENKVCLHPWTRTNVRRMYKDCNTPSEREGLNVFSKR